MLDSIGGRLRRPTHGRLRVLLLMVALAAAAAVALARLMSASAGAPPSGALVVSDGHTTAPGIYVAADVLSGPASNNSYLRNGPQRLPQAALVPLIGSDGPAAVPSRDGEKIAYNTWRWTRKIDWYKAFSDQGISTGDELAVPTVRVHDTATGSDLALEAGSETPVWSASGALAYVRGEPTAFRANTPYTTKVLVRRAVGAQPEIWTTVADRYHLYGWAGNSLIVVRELDGGSLDIYALDGPNRLRLIGHDAGILAITPDGKQVVLNTGDVESGQGVLSLRNVADGGEAASFLVPSAKDSVTQEPLRWIGGPGSWAGDRLLLPSSHGLVVFSAGGSSLALEQVMHFDIAAETNGSISEPRFGDATGQTIVFWAAAPRGRAAPMAVQFTCNRMTLSCKRNPAVPASATPRPAYDPSGGDK
jgi:hypothetical protein